MNVHNAGIRPIIITTVILIAINGLLYYSIESITSTYLVMIISSITLIFVVCFYRNPKRVYTGDRATAIVSPADGTIVAIEEVLEPEYFGDRRILVSVFMSIANVHVNWYPIDARVIIKEHHKGRHSAAYLPKSSTENERSTIVLRREDGLEILVRQIAGAIAKRIITYPEVGDEGYINEHFGFIKLGSRVDLYLPLDTNINVVINQKVKGCQTLIGTCRAKV